ncbi:pyridoxamine 5'-phosphate oxidase family protein [Desulfospira joergensenii]|uniref:pyridoxamine 5'-phosphate oxidase family protein n=1 Tax=Desulfospira joergensenii TaxID=53329 RepID=UPI0003B602A9|nr:pyridoxamine 5'-phosphate oxidase family protein [Desulfospira joergensenii]
MSLEEYFETTAGTGILATSDRDGKVDAAVYSRPHFMEDGSMALIMRDRLSHANLQDNPQAAFLFVQEGKGYQGKRLFLTRVREEKNSDLLFRLRQRTYPEKDPFPGDPLFLVFFKIEKELPLIGPGDEVS